MRMHLTAGLLSLGIAFAGVTAPAPARADTQDVALIVGSAIAALALTKILEDKSKSDKKKPKTYYSKRNPPRYQVPSYDRGRDYDNDRGRGNAYGHYKDKARGNAYGHDKQRGNFWQTNRLVPSQCFYRYSGRNGMQGVFGERCMAGVMGSTRHLPSTCRRTEGRQFSRAPAYDAACLRSRGYRVEARRR